MKYMDAFSISIRLEGEGSNVSGDSFFGITVTILNLSPAICRRILRCGSMLTAITGRESSLLCVQDGKAIAAVMQMTAMYLDRFFI